MHILIDTNIILDLIQNREPHTENASKIINSIFQYAIIQIGMTWKMVFK